MHTSSEPLQDPVYAELQAGGLLGELADVAKRHQVSIAITVTPVADEPEGEPQ